MMYETFRKAQKLMVFLAITKKELNRSLSSTSSNSGSMSTHDWSFDEYKQWIINEDFIETSSDTSDSEGYFKNENEERMFMRDTVTINILESHSPEKRKTDLESELNENYLNPNWGMIHSSS